MSNLFACLRTSADTLSAYSEALDITQNNVSNASTPGYARQTVQLTAKSFDPNSGLSGGVDTAEIESTRDQFAEQSVRAKTTSLGEAQQKATSLTSIESLFDVSGDAGLADAFSGFYEAASTWAESPNDTVARQSVIDQAATVAGSFSQLASGLAKVEDSTEKQIQQTVDEVNSLAERLRGYNEQILNGGQNDAGLDAAVNSTLEELSKLADVSVLRQDDGSATVLLNGETPLVMGEKQFDLTYKLEAPKNATYADARQAAHIVTSSGRDITAKSTGGQLGALLEVHNTVIPGYLGDGTRQGDLNKLAQQFADRVNTLLSSGTTAGGSAGVALFTYDSTSPSTIAQTLQVDSSVSADQLAAADSEASNGTALALAHLSDPEDNSDKIDGFSYTEFYGNMASHVGTLLDDAKNDANLQESLLTQAKDQREEMSGVSLDQEAVILTEFQKAYEAVSKVITVLDQITETTIDMLQR